MGLVPRLVREAKGLFRWPKYSDFNGGAKKGLDEKRINKLEKPFKVLSCFNV
jgi:hypothetical protein